ncbi:disulfide bond formation protein B [Candidatus Parcubacteria bacterium]|nr:disulfide bond formation protein B [Candidatus Parcubacteria bacterium]
MITYIQKNAMYLILVQVFVAIVGSLYFSDVKGFEPCVLCWYQRIFMYPLLPVVAIALWRKENKIYQYTLPMAMLGIIISIYHNLLYTGIIKNEEFCSTGISCTSKYIEYFGFVTIPFLAFLGFAVIIGLSIINRNYIKKQNK